MATLVLMSEAYLDPLGLSRQLGGVRTKVLRFLGRTRAGVAAPPPFSDTLFPGKSQYDAVRALPGDDALRNALLRHLQVLIRARVQSPWVEQILLYAYTTRHPVREPWAAEMSLAEVRLRAHTLDESRPLWEKTRDELAGPLLGMFEELWCREAEIDHRLQPEPLTLGPFDSVEALGALARDVVQQSQDALSQLGYLEEAALDRLLFRDAAEGWPAQLRMSSLLDVFRDPTWLRGLELEPTRPRARVSPLSFLLAYGDVGESIGRALARKDLPFVVARSPFDEVPQRLGLTLALLSTSAPFQRRRLGLGRARAERAERALLLAMLIELRRRAVRFLVTEAAKSGRAALREVEPWAVSVLSGGDGPPSGLLGRLLRVEPSGVDFFSLLLALRDVDAMRQRFEEDWFDDPRALEFLRAEAELVPEPVLPVDAVRAVALRVVADWLARA